MKMVFRALVFVLGAYVFPLVAASSSLKSVDANSFETTVANTDHVWLLEFMSPRCGTCKEMAPVYEQVAASLSDKFEFGTVNIDDKAGMELAKSTNALNDGIPCVMAFRSPGGKPLSVWTGNDAPSAAELEKLVLSKLKANPQDPNGKYLKTSHQNLGRPSKGSQEF